MSDASEAPECPDCGPEQNRMPDGPGRSVTLAVLNSRLKFEN